MRLRNVPLTVMLAALCALRCNGGSSTSPTGFQLAITVALQNSAQAATILDAQLVIDGVLVQETTESDPASLAQLVSTGFLVAGSHSLSVVIAAQTSTPNNYTSPSPDIRVFDLNGNLVKELRLATQSANLATGQGISYSFSL